MKKILLVVTIFFLPIFVYAGTCSVITDTQTTDDRSLTCDKTSQKITKYNSSEETVLSNGVCQVKCTESLAFSVDPIKKVLAGTSFNYPLYVSGERKCTAVYDYVSYETTIRKLVDEYAVLTGDAKITKGNELVNYYNKKKECDEFAVADSDYENKYTMKGTVSLKVQTSTKTDTLNYKYRSISDYSSNLNKDEIRYYACDYNEASRTCNESMRTIYTWTETARIFGKYTMPYLYLEKYTGEVKSASSATTCNAGDRYFVSLNELTKPLSGVTTDNGYKLTLTGTNLGNNLVKTGDKWNLNVSCWYQVKNLAFPQGGETIISSDTDENYELYGNVAFTYRQIDLDNPFPDRDPYSNWYGKEGLITSTASNIDKMSAFEITLNRSLIKKVREYNESNQYQTFKLDEMEKSLFIINNPSIIDRK